MLCILGAILAWLIIASFGMNHDIRGRFGLFFPGEFDINDDRLLDARDGWNYLAVPITLDSAGLA